MAPTFEDVGSKAPPPSLPPSPLPPASPAREHEFGGGESAVIGGLGVKMSRVGLFMVGIGLCFVISTIQRWSRFHEMDVGLIFLTLLFIIFGVWTHRAGREFRSVSTSKGKDVSHLMAAMMSLLKLYSVVYVIFFVALIFALIQLVAENMGG